MRIFIAFLFILSTTLVWSQRVILQDIILGRGNNQNVELSVNSVTPEKPSIRYNEALGVFEFSNDGTVYQEIGSGGGGGTSNETFDFIIDTGGELRLVGYDSFVFDGVLGLNALPFVTGVTTGTVGAPSFSAWSPDSRIILTGKNAAPFLESYVNLGSQFVAGTVGTQPISTPQSQCLAWSPDSKYLAIGTNTTPFVEFYTVLSSGALLRLGQPTTVASGNCRSLEFVDNDTVVMVAAGLASRSVFRYNLPSFSEDSVILDQLATNTARGALTLSNTHLMVVAPSLLRVYDLAAGTFISFAYTNPSPSYIVRVPNTNKFLIGAGTNASFPEVEYFEYTGSAIVKLTGGVELAGESVRGIDIHPKGDQIVITTNFNGLVTLYDADFSTSAPVVTQIAALTPNTNSPEAAFSPDGRSLWIQTSTTHGFYKSSQRISTQNKIPRLIRDYRP